MTSFAIGIVAHTSRRAQARRLARKVESDTGNLDDGTLGCRGNHLRVWHQLTELDGWREDPDWLVVLEDDAKPVAGFRDQLTQALAVAPATIVSLYLGRTRPRTVQTQIAAAALVADAADASWIVGRELFHAVAVAIRAELVPDMLAKLPPPPLAIDAAISTWATNHRPPLPVAYAWPSICDHDDHQPSLTRHPYQKLPSDKHPRVAWKTAARNHWTTTKVGL